MGGLRRETCIAVDAMGSDKGVGEVVAGVCEVLKSDRGGLKIIVVGDENAISSEFKTRGFYRDSRIEIKNATQVIQMDEKPIQVIRSKKDSSMMVAIDLVKSDQADAVLSCGNTGAMMAAGTLKLRTMTGIDRPALATIIPSATRKFVLIDVGANPDPKPNNMFDNAILGANYARIAMNISNPRVALLSNGTEDCKGNMLTHQTNELLKNANGLSGTMEYAGLIEGFQVFNGDSDVIVCDGFTGNVLLKTLESLVKMMKGMVKEELTRTTVRKIGALLAKSAFLDIKKRLSIENFSGAPLLGLNNLVVKGHGSSDYKQIAGALKIAIQCVRRDLNRRISDDVAKLKKASEHPVETSKEE